MRFLLSILIVLATIIPAQAALKWDYQSTSVTKAKYATGWGDMVRVLSATAIPLTAGPAGTFGGTYLDMTTKPTIYWSGADNAPVGSTAITVMFRLIPVGTGNPAATVGLFSLGGVGATGGAYTGFEFSIDTSSRLIVTGGTLVNAIAYKNAAVFATGITFTANVPVDVWFVWDGTTTAGHMELWTAQNGNTATKISTLTSSAVAVAVNRAAMTGFTNMDAPNFNTGTANNIYFHYNEIAVFDTAEVPSSYGARTDFIYTGAQYEGYNFTSLAANKVLNATAYGPGPGSLTGTLTSTDPGIAHVTLGTTYQINSGGTLTGTFTSAYTAASNVRLGTDRGDGTTGTLVVAAPSDVRNGVSTDATTGTAYIPAAADTRFGTNVDATTGTCHIPTAAQTFLGTAVDATTGTRDDAVPANVLTGIVYAGGLKTGTMSINLNVPKVILGL